MSWTQEQLDALNAAIAEGATRVRYGDREVQYRSLAEMTQLRDAMRRALGLTTSEGARRVLAYSKGT